MELLNHLRWSIKWDPKGLYPPETDSEIKEIKNKFRYNIVKTIGYKKTLKYIK